MAPWAKPLKNKASTYRGRRAGLKTKGAETRLAVQRQTGRAEFTVVSVQTKKMLLSFVFFIETSGLMMDTRKNTTTITRGNLGVKKWNSYFQLHNIISKTFKSWVYFSFFTIRGLDSSCICAVVGAETFSCKPFSVLHLLKAPHASTSHKAETHHEVWRGQDWWSWCWTSDSSLIPRIWIGLRALPSYKSHLCVDDPGVEADKRFSQSPESSAALTSLHDKHLKYLNLIFL